MASTSKSPAMAPLNGTIVDIVSPEIELQARKGVELVAAKAAVTFAAVRSKALLADAALGHAASLSALESHLTDVAPSGRDRYKHIADSFAIAAAQTIQWS